MKKIILWSSLLVLGGNLVAQNPLKTTINQQTTVQNAGVISGKVLDHESNMPIPYAAVSVKIDNKIIAGTMTKENGSFIITNVPTGNLTIEIVFMGYKKQEMQVVVPNDTKTLNVKNIFIEESTKQLNEVVVTKDKAFVEQKIDRKVITVSKDLQTAGATAADLMNNIPTVNVDMQNNTVSLRGNENVRIFIDGKPSNLTPIQVLQQIPSTSIKQIELITNPSAKYNPEGMSGIINIVLVKGANMGFNGNVSLGTVFAITPKINGSLDLNYKVNKFNIYANYSANHGKRNSKGKIKWDNYDAKKDYTLDVNVKNFNRNHFIKIGTDYYLNDKNTISFYTLQNIDNSPVTFLNSKTYNNNVLPKESQIQNATGIEHNQTYNFAFKHLFNKEGKTLDLELNYNKTNEPENSLFTNENQVMLFENKVTKKGNNFIGNLDYVNPLNETSKIEFGLESRIEQNSTLFDINKINNSNFNFDRNIQSVYGTYSKQLGKWSTQLGVRLENYYVKGTFNKVGFLQETFTDNLITAYPSAFFTYTPSEANAFNFNYSRRVDRPNMQQVNKIRQWSSLDMEQIGNTTLKPQFTNSFEINYTRKIKLGSLTTGTFARIINNEIEQVITSNPYDPNKRLMTFANFDKNTEYGLEFSGNLDLKKWWNMNFGTDCYFNTNRGIIEKRDGSLQNLSVHNNLLNARMNHTFKVNKDFRIIWFAMYNAGQKGLQFSNKNMWKTDLGARLNLLKNKGSLTIRYNDIFNSLKSRFYGDEPALTEGKFQWESQSITINFNYRFGSGRNKALDRKQRDKNESSGGGMF